MKKFIAGFLFGTIGYALISQSCEVMGMVTELVRGKLGVKIEECNNQIKELSGEAADKIHPIGY
jgi:hypothetical protein